MMIFLSMIAVLLTIFILSSQSSSLWSSLITIPFSFLIISMMSKNIYSSLFLFIYVMIFIGGLLVLLVSVTSISYQEQTFNFSKILLIIGLLSSYPFFSNMNYFFDFSPFLIFSLWLWEKLVFFFILWLLIVSIFIITKMVMTFKGMVRLN